MGNKAIKEYTFCTSLSFPECRKFFLFHLFPLNNAGTFGTFGSDTPAPPGTCHTNVLPKIRLLKRNFKFPPHPNTWGRPGLI